MTEAYGGNFFPPSGFDLSRRYIPASGDITGNADLSAINAAISSGGETELGPGNFYINKGIAIGLSNVHLRGQGPDQTIINYVGPNNGHNAIEVTAGLTQAT